MISFIIPYLNTPVDLVGFFNEMAPQSLEHEFVVIDNGSGPDLFPTGPLSTLMTNYSNLTVITPGENLGFGRANNEGARIAVGNVLCFTQPDVRFLGDVTALIHDVDDYGLYGHRLLNFDTGWNKFGDVLVPYLEGYFLVCSKGNWELLGGFDENYYPADFEDVDLSYTAHLKGLRIINLPKVPVVHTKVGGTWQQFKNRQEVTHKNRAYFMQKWKLNDT